MLDTALAIGRAFRRSAHGMKHHRYIKACPEDTDTRKLLRLSLPVREDFSFDFANLNPIGDENYQREKLFYLRFKTSDSDSYIRYAFGDILYERTSNDKKESGNYLTRRYSERYDSFALASKVLENCKTQSIVQFRVAFEANRDKIEDILYAHTAVFLHFKFGDKAWFQIDGALDALNAIMIEQFTSPFKHDWLDGVVFDSMLYRTLCSGDKKNDRQFPAFLNENKYKSRLFSVDEVKDLFYSIDYTEKPLLRVARDIKIIVLPRGKNLSAQHYQRFNDRSYSSESHDRETRLASDNKIESDNLFECLTQDVAENIVQFDLILSKQGGQSSPDVDMVELAGIEKSHLQDIDYRIKKIKSALQDQFQQELGGEPKSFQIEWSFKNLLGDSTSKMKKYKSHLYKVIPQIYTASYFQDPILLPALIAKTESNIRKETSSNFNFLKYDFYFLTKLQNTKPEGANLMQIQESASYRVGLLLGHLARPLRTPIKSFEKSYVGNLTRRISTLAELIRFKTFLEEKLVIHERTYPNIRDASIQLANLLKQFSGGYDKNECAFGFFETYFAPFSPDEQETKESEELNQDKE